MKKPVVRPIGHKCPECNGTGFAAVEQPGRPASGFIRHSARIALAREELPTEVVLLLFIFQLFRLVC
jgi:hypothetical protein